jgi:hypothetical protein
MMRILVAGSESMDFVAALLSEKGYAVSRVQARKRSLYLDVAPRFDVIYAGYLMNGARLAKIAKFLGKKFVMHIIGTDAVRYAREKFSLAWYAWLLGLTMSSQILYAAENLQRLVGFKGTVLPLPVDTRLFKKQNWKGHKRDIVYYSPNGDPTYRPDWIAQYAWDHPDEEITVIGTLGCQKVPANVLTIPHLDRSAMPRVYSKHKRLVRMTTHDGTPRMIYEALLCGLEVIWNGKMIESVPSEVTPEHFVAEFTRNVDTLYGLA